MQTQFQFRIKHTTVARHFKRSKYIILFPKMGQFFNKKKSPSDQADRNCSRQM